MAGFGFTRPKQKNTDLYPKCMRDHELLQVCETEFTHTFINHHLLGGGVVINDDLNFSL